MTKKDYKLIANTFWRIGYLPTKNKKEQIIKDKIIKLLVSDLAANLANDNPLFNKDLFYQACGIK